MTKNNSLSLSLSLSLYIYIYIYIYIGIFIIFLKYIQKDKGHNWVTTITTGFEGAAGSASGVNA